MSLGIAHWAAPGATGDFRPNYLREVLAHSLREAKAWRLIWASALIEAAASLISPWVASRVLDTAIPSSASSMLGVLALTVVIAAGHTAAAAWLHERTSVLLAHRLETVCLSQVLERYLETPYQQLDASQYGETNETLNSVSLGVLTLVHSSVQLVTLTFSGVATLSMLALYNPGLAMSTALLVAILAAVSVVLSLRELRAVRDLLRASSQSHELLHVLISAIPTLRATGATERLVERWAGLVRGQTLHGIRRDNLRLSRVVLAQAGRHAATWLATVWLVQHALTRSISLGVLMAATLLVGNWVRIGTGLTGTILSFVSLRPHWERVNALLANAVTQERVPLSANDVRQASAQGLRLSDVSFRYEAHGRFILDAYSTHFPAGKHTILRAASGSGKSTILRLLAGLVAPEAGQVTVFGRDPRLCTGLVAYLPQQSTLLEASIGTNLTTLSGAKLEHALRVAQRTGLAEMLATLPMGHETLVAAGGSNLSAGQRQLLLLTAAFSGVQPVVLLDEPTSQLDAAALSRIQWSELCQGRTVVSVTHA